MAEAYFGLSDAPFRLSPDAKFYFGSQGHNKAMAYLHFGLKQAEGFIVITGPVGSGKTLLINHLLDQLDRSTVVAAQLQTASIEPADLLPRILAAFQIEAQGEGRTAQLEALEDYLYDQLQRGRRVLLVLDEAQNLPLKTLEEIRMLSNIDYDGTPMFQVFLVGQPEFRRVLASGRLEQLRQRVIASYHLEALSRDETREYILHRLSVVGWRRDPVFMDDAVDEIFRFTSGLPRRINLVCNRLMLCASIEKRHEIDRELVLRIVKEMRAEHAAGTNRQKSGSQKKQKPGAIKRPTPPAGLQQRHHAASLAQSRSIIADAVNANTILESAVATDTLVSDAASAARQRTPKFVAQSGTARPEPPSRRRATKIDPPPVVAAPPPPAPALPPQSQSVLDRVRADRTVDGETDEPSASPRAPATLQDVASAIAAATQAPPVDDLREALKESQMAAAIIAQEDEQNREADGFDLNDLRQSLERARAEIKDAQGSLASLRDALTGAQKRHIETRADVAKSLARAQSLLVEIGDGLQ
ncbi:MAG: XrtA/PEP-CTERM system-associated ATPase [Pseudomonadota bacterium]